MKKLLLSFVALVMLSGASFSQPAVGGYIGLFTDVAHTTFTLTHPGAGFLPFTMYIYFLPGPLGMQGAEFQIAYPTNVIGSTVTPHDSISVSLGALSSGISIAFFNCQPTGVWVASHRQSCFLTSTAQTLIEIVAHSTSGAYQIASCELGFPLYPVTKFTNICCNQLCAVAAPNKTWGAIKNLF